jgi:hypothetical protein
MPLDSVQRTVYNIHCTLYVNPVYTNVILVPSTTMDEQRLQKQSFLFRVPVFVSHQPPSSATV